MFGIRTGFKKINKTKAGDMPLILPSTIKSGVINFEEARKIIFNFHLWDQKLQSQRCNYNPKKTKSESGNLRV